ncbi:hypothetical protein TSMEX_007218 [Taenia solium]|eukprot:TsM_000981100 transcript=TsM_000981100 gene=TsM_000981100
MSHNTQPSNSSCEEEGENPSTALANLPTSKGLNLEEWLKSSLVKEYFHRDQKPGEDDEEYVRNLQRLAEWAFRCPSPNRVTDWVAAQSQAVARPSTIAAKICAVKTNDLIESLNG